LLGWQRSRANQQVTAARAALADTHPWLHAGIEGGARELNNVCLGGALGIFAIVVASDVGMDSPRESVSSTKATGFSRSSGS
jgi:hypothetical protein